MTRLVTSYTPRTVYGLLCEYIGHLRYTDGSEKSDGPERRPLEGTRMRHQRPCRRPLKPERAALALWVTPVHASSMAESTADDHLTLDGDANVYRRR